MGLYGDWSLTGSNISRLHLGSPHTICHGLNVYGVRFFVVFFFLFFFEFCFVPSVVAQGGVADSAGIDDYLFRMGLEFCAAEIGGGSLQGVEEEGGLLGVDLVG